MNMASLLFSCLLLVIKELNLTCDNENAKESTLLEVHIEEIQHFLELPKSMLAKAHT